MEDQYLLSDGRAGTRSNATPQETERTDALAHNLTDDSSAFHAELERK